jgi:hypothetical protein
MNHNIVSIFVSTIVIFFVFSCNKKNDTQVFKTTKEYLPFTDTFAEIGELSRIHHEDSVSHKGNKQHIINWIMKAQTDSVLDSNICTINNESINIVRCL